MYFRANIASLVKGFFFFFSPFSSEEEDEELDEDEESEFFFFLCFLDLILLLFELRVSSLFFFAFNFPTLPETLFSSFWLFDSPLPETSSSASSSSSLIFALK